MRFAILGTGIVGSTLGSALLAADHEVRMGSRSASNPRAALNLVRARPASLELGEPTAVH